MQTAVRVRPTLFKYENESPLCTKVERKNQTVMLKDPFNGGKKTFAMDSCFDSSIGPSAPGFASQDSVWQTIGLKAVQEAFGGTNASVIAFGQTGTGKTHTMFSTDGLVNRISSELLRRGLNDDGEGFHMEISMLQIYEDAVLDLLVDSGKPLKVCEAPMGPMYASGAVSVDVRSQDHLDGIIAAGLQSKAVRASVCNAVSSRAHTFCILNVTRSGGARSVVTLADLAGNERHLNMGASGDRLLETNKVNTSLEALDALVNDMTGRETTEGLDDVDLYKGSPLTGLLKPALGGNGRAWWIATVSPAYMDYEETLTTLRLCDRLRSIAFSATANMNYLETFKEAMNTRAKELREAMESLKPSDSEAENKKAATEATIAEFSNRLKDLQYPWNKRDLSANPELKETIKRNNLPDLASKKYLTNVAMDGHLSNRVFYVLDKPKVSIGCDDQADISVPGIAVEPNHCNLSVNDKGAQLTCLGNSLCLVNGKTVGSGETIQVIIGDTIALGTSLLYQLASGHPDSNRLKTWENAAREIHDGTVRGLSSNFKMLKDQTKRSSRGIKQVKVPLEHFEKSLLKVSMAVAEANGISKILHKHETFEAVVLPGETQHERDLNIAVNVTTLQGGKKTMSTWTSDKFYMRFFMMKKLHVDYVSKECNRNIRTLDKKYPQEKDPFHDPPPDMVIGVAMVYLNPLTYVCAIDTPISIIDMRGSNEGELLVNIKPEVFKSPTDSTAVDTDDEGLEEEPRLAHFEHGRLKIHMSITGIRGLQSNKQSGVYAMFKWFSDPNAKSTTVSREEMADPPVKFSEIFLENITTELIDYCANDVIEVTVFCQPPEGGIPMDNMQGLREGFISEEPPATSIHSVYAPKKEAAGPNMFNPMQGAVLEGEVLTPRRDDAEYEARMKEAYDERERLELKIRALQAQLQNQKKSSSCSLL